jgi:hypothetical protein
MGLRAQICSCLYMAIDDYDPPRLVKCCHAGRQIWPLTANPSVRRLRGMALCVSHNQGGTSAFAGMENKLQAACMCFISFYVISWNSLEHCRVRLQLNVRQCVGATQFCTQSYGRRYALPKQIVSQCIRNVQCMHSLREGFIPSRAL